MARYDVLIKASAAKEFEAIPHKKDRQRLAEKIKTLAEDPRPTGCEKLHSKDRYRLRQGQYRVVYAIDDELRNVVVVKIGHRKDVYR